MPSIQIRHLLNIYGAINVHLYKISSEKLFLYLLQRCVASEMWQFTNITENNLRNWTDYLHKAASLKVYFQFLSTSSKPNALHASWNVAY